MVVCATEFLVIAGHLYNMGWDDIHRWYVTYFEWNSILTKAHGGAMGRPYARKETAQKILWAGLWWPTLHKDCKPYCRECDACQRMGKPSQRDELPLNLQVSFQPFEKWAIDFVGMTEPPGKKRDA